MKQHYFVVVLAHSLHGRLRRVHIPHQALYVVLGLALIGSFSMFGAVSSYLRMTWKVANYNTLRTEVDTLRTQYHALQQQNNQKDAQLAELQLLASEVTLALGLKKTLDSSSDIVDEGLLVPLSANPSTSTISSSPPVSPASIEPTPEPGKRIRCRLSGQ